MNYSERIGGKEWVRFPTERAPDNEPLSTDRFIHRRGFKPRASYFPGGNEPSENKVNEVYRQIVELACCGEINSKPVSFLKPELKVHIPHLSQRSRWIRSSLASKPCYSLDGPGVRADFYSQLIKYCPATDVLAVALGSRLHFIFSENWEEIYLINDFTSGVIRQLAFSPDGKQLFVSVEESDRLNLVQYLYLTDGGPHFNKGGEIQSNDSLTCEEMIAADDVMYLGLSNGKIYKTNFQFTASSSFSSSSTDKISGLALSPNHRILIAGRNAGLIDLFSVDSASHLQSIDIYSRLSVAPAVKAIAFSPEGDYFVTGGGFTYPYLMLWKTANPSAPLQTEDTSSQIIRLFWLDDFIVSVQRNQELKFWPIDNKNISAGWGPVISQCTGDEPINQAYASGAELLKKRDGTQIMVVKPALEKLECWDLPKPLKKADKSKDLMGRFSETMTNLR